MGHIGSHAIETAASKDAVRKNLFIIEPTFP
jgi:hypothetical protein